MFCPSVNWAAVWEIKWQNAPILMDRARGTTMSLGGHCYSNEIHINVHFMLNQWTYYQHMANVKHLLLIIVCVSHPHIYEIVLTCSASKVVMWQKFNIIIPFFLCCAHSFIHSFRLLYVAPFFFILLHFRQFILYSIQRFVV